MESPRSSSDQQVEAYFAMLMGGAPTAGAPTAGASSFEQGSRQHASCAPATPTHGSPTHTRPASPADSPALGVATRPPDASAAAAPSQDAALACLLSRYPEADVAVLMYFLLETSGHLEKAAAEYRRWKESRGYRRQRPAVGPSDVSGTTDAPLPEPPASPPPPPTVPLPIPLTGARMHTPNSDDESGCWESWPEAYSPGGDAMVITKGCGAPYDAPHDTSPSCAGMAGADLAAAKLAGLQLEGSASFTYDGAPHADAHPPFATHTGTLAHDASADGRSWQDISGAALPSTWRPPPPPRRDDEAARRDASKAFVSAQQQVSALRDEAEACRTQAINKRRMNRPLEAAQLERHAATCSRKACYVQDRASHEAYQRTNKDNVLVMQPINLHNLTVDAAMKKLEEVVALAWVFISQGIYSAVEVPFITGRGAHSADGVPKIRLAAEEWMDARGIGYCLENAGGQVVAWLA